ncbi:MAG: glycosyltransferase family 2 protein [Pseudomonadota bacterium]
MADKAMNGQLSVGELEGSSTGKPLLSVIVPFFNEEALAEPMIDALVEVLSPQAYRFEIVCIDDGSEDGTGAVIDRRASAHSALVPVHLSRRFGKEAALLAGLQIAQGDAVVLLDGDLQHPPSLIPSLVEAWMGGVDVVHAVKRRHGRESLVYRQGATIFYKLLGRAVGRSLSHTSDYKLLDRQVVEALLVCGERSRFLRGLVAWVGFTTAEVLFDVDPRRSGHSKWSLLQLAKYAFNALLSFTSLPLRLIAWMGFATIVVGMLLAVQTLYNYFAGIAVGGFTTVILLQILLCGLILASLGVMSFYQAQMYEEIKARPVYIVRRQTRSHALGATTPDKRTLVDTTADLASDRPDMAGGKGPHTPAGGDNA